MRLALALLFSASLARAADCHTAARKPSVATAEELVAAIGPDTCVTLAPGIFDLTPLVERSVAAGHRAVSVGPFAIATAGTAAGAGRNEAGVRLGGVDGLVLLGAGPGATRLVQRRWNAAVLILGGSRDVRLEGLSLEARARQLDAEEPTELHGPYTPAALLVRHLAGLTLKDLHVVGQEWPALLLDSVEGATLERLHLVSRHSEGLHVEDSAAVELDQVVLRTGQRPAFSAHGSTPLDTSQVVVVSPDGGVRPTASAVVQRWPQALRVPAVATAEGARVPVNAGPFLSGPVPSIEGGEPRVRRSWPRTTWLSRTEVTVGEYRACQAAGACSPVASSGLEVDGPWRAACEGLDESLPVACVTREQARRYCRFVGGRLPAALEWEKAVRGEGERPYPWGVTEPTCARLATVFRHCPFDQGCARATLHVPCSHPAGASAAGACDLEGNVAEWTQEGWLVGSDVAHWPLGVPVKQRAEQRAYLAGIRCAFDAPR